MTRQPLWICWLGLIWLVGCRGLPGHVSPCDPVGRGPSRKGLVLRQVAADTALETWQHPLKRLRTLLSLPVDYGTAVMEIGLRRRLDGFNRGVPPPISLCWPTLDPQALEEVLRRRSGKELQPAWVELCPTGEDALASLNRVIDQAVCRIDILMYLWDNDPLGWEVAHRLAAVAGPDRLVRILVDGGGNLTQGEPREASAAEVNAVVCWLSRQPYVQVIRTRDPGFHFDHRKLVVVDGRVAWSGGRNFTEPAFFHDRDVSYTMAGPLAGQMEELFEEFWQHQGGAPAPPLALAPPLPVVNAMARLVETSPYQRGLSQVVYRALDAAGHHVYMENPYLTDNRILLKLIDARKRGADVRVVMTIHDDSTTINRSNKVTVNRLLGAGIRVYLYPGMTHVKATAVDGVWAYLGTGNFDRLSLRHNRELGLAISSGPVIEELEERVFLPDFNPEWEVNEPLPLAPQDYLSALVGSLLL